MCLLLATLITLTNNTFIYSFINHFFLRKLLTELFQYRSIILSILCNSEYVSDNLDWISTVKELLATCKVSILVPCA